MIIYNNARSTGNYNVRYIVLGHKISGFYEKCFDEHIITPIITSIRWNRETIDRRMRRPERIRWQRCVTTDDFEIPSKDAVFSF